MNSLIVNKKSGDLSPLFSFDLSATVCKEMYELGCRHSGNEVTLLVNDGDAANKVISNELHNTSPF
jgi:hypothetical protein